MTHIFDVRTRVDGDDITVLDAQVVAHDTIQAAAAIIQVVIGEHNQNSVLSLLASDEDGITTEQLECLHGVVGQCDNGVIIVDGIGDPELYRSALELLLNAMGKIEAIVSTYINWLGFFFFLRMAVAVSSSSLRSAPEASLQRIVSGSVFTRCTNNDGGVAEAVALECWGSRTYIR